MERGFYGSFEAHSCSHITKVVNGKFRPGDTEVQAGRLGNLSAINGSEVLLGAPYVFNKENIGNFDF